LHESATIPSSDYRQFLKLLRAARQRAGLTQIEAAARMDATQTFVSKCERGERRLDVVELRNWCAALGVPFRNFVAEFEQCAAKLKKRTK
jgi:transcriptional regulator with XRE-family HTH domain